MRKREDGLQSSSGDRSGFPESLRGRGSDSVPLDAAEECAQRGVVQVWGEHDLSLCSPCPGGVPVRGGQEELPAVTLPVLLFSP